MVDIIRIICVAYAVYSTVMLFRISENDVDKQFFWTLNGVVAICFYVYLHWME